MRHTRIWRRQPQVGHVLLSHITCQQTSWYPHTFPPTPILLATSQPLSPRLQNPSSLAPNTVGSHPSLIVKGRKPAPLHPSCVNHNTPLSFPATPTLSRCPLTCPYAPSPHLYLCLAHAPCLCFCPWGDKAQAQHRVSATQTKLKLNKTRAGELTPDQHCVLLHTEHSTVTQYAPKCLDMLRGVWHAAESGEGGRAVCVGREGGRALLVA